MRDRNTTIAGVLTIVGALVDAGLSLSQHKPLNLPVTLAAISTGVGLIKAADSKKPPTAPTA